MISLSHLVSFLWAAAHFIPDKLNIAVYSFPGQKDGAGLLLHPAISVYENAHGMSWRTLFTLSLEGKPFRKGSAGYFYEKKKKKKKASHTNDVRLSLQRRVTRNAYCFRDIKCSWQGHGFAVPSVRCTAYSVNACTHDTLASIVPHWHDKPLPNDCSCSLRTSMYIAQQCTLTLSMRSEARLDGRDTPPAAPIPPTTQPNCSCAKCDHEVAQQAI